MHKGQKSEKGRIKIVRLQEFHSTVQRASSFANKAFGGQWKKKGNFENYHAVGFRQKLAPHWSFIHFFEFSTNL